MTPFEFIAESNRIEGIYRPTSDMELSEFERFMALDVVSVADLECFVKVYQPNAVLRDRVGLDALIGDHVPPKGGPKIRVELERLLRSGNDDSCDAFQAHLRYETLHPFTDGNGRSGRMLWAWWVGYDVALHLGFLHRFYYQTLAASSRFLRSHETRELK